MLQIDYHLRILFKKIFKKLIENLVVLTGHKAMHYHLLMIKIIDKNYI